MAALWEPPRWKDDTMRSRFCLALWLWLLALPCLGHGFDDGFLQLTLKPEAWEGVWKSPIALWADCDDDHDGVLSREELQRHWANIVGDKVSLVDQAGVQAPLLLGAGPITQSPAQLTLPVTIARLPSTRTWSLDYRAFLPQAKNQQCLALMLSSEGESLSLLLKPESPRQEIGWTQPRGLQHFFFLGVEHILTGYDHLTFLLTLVIVGGSLWRWFQVITAFSVAHSLSLALAVFGVVHLPSTLIEPTIAISITVAALSSLRKIKEGKLDGGWQLAFGFGLVHGLGFAGVLQELQLTGWEAAGPLVGFNLGVEAGQLTVAALMLPVIRKLCQVSWGVSARQSVCALSGSVGLYWFFTRLS